ncbi:MAG: dihydrofolate reductase [Bacteroidota bacterium]
MILSLIVAIDRRGGIGKDNQLLWHLPADLKHFKSITTGYTVIMGRKTHESIGRPLPNRRNIVLSRSLVSAPVGCEIMGSLDEALLTCKDEQKAFVIGGAEIYRLAIDKADELFLTRVDTLADADTFFPEFNTVEWELQSREELPADEKNAFSCAFEHYTRKKKA